MKKFNIGLKKDKGDKSANIPSPSSASTPPSTTDDSSTRNRLFGSRNKTNTSSSPAPASSNPYAAIPSSSKGGNPYANVAQTSLNPYQPSGNGYHGSSSNAQNLDARAPYLQNSRGSSPAPGGGSGGGGYGSNGYGAMKGTGEDMLRPPSIASQPPAYDATGGYASTNESGYRNEKSPASQQNGYGGYANTGQYGAQAGYGGGGDRWSETSSIATTRVGGYGGYGRPDSRETLDLEEGKEALFGGARERLQQKQVQGQLPPEEDPAQGYSGGGGGTSSDGYGYGSSGYDRQMTAEEQEEEDVQATKNQIRDLKRQDVSETRNALRTAAQAEETGRATLERLGLQGERIHNAERNLDLSSNQNRLADEKYREIKRLNRSMFAPNVANPFTKSKRQEQMDAAVIEQHHKDKSRREETRAAAYQSMERSNAAQRRLREQWEKDNGAGGGAAGTGGGNAKNPARLAERSKYQFEADSEDETLEDEIDGNLDALSGAAGRLNMLGRAIGAELESQNKHIDRVAAKVDEGDDQLEMLRAKLARIK